MRLTRKCSGFYIWVNPDGTLGGEVSFDASVHASAIIERYATVLAGAVIPAGQRVLSGVIVESDGNQITFAEPRDFWKKLGPSIAQTQRN